MDGRWSSATWTRGWAVASAFYCADPKAANWECAGSIANCPRRSAPSILESFDDFPGESVVTAVLTESDGATTLVSTILYPSRDVRDAVIKSGMEHGAAESYDKLAEMLAKAVGSTIATGGGTT